MGSSTSKAARSAAAATRKYPTRIPQTAPPSQRPNPQQPLVASTSDPTPQSPTAPSPSPSSPNPTISGPGPTVHPPPSASPSKTSAITSDASDPDFAASLRSLGPVNPNSTLSNSSAFSPQGAQGNVFPNPAMNPAVKVLEVRERLVREAEAEFARVRGYADEMGGAEGGRRRFLDVMAIRQVLVMRDEKGLGEGEIEKRLGLEAGVVGRLGGKGVVGEVGMGRGG